MSFFHDNKCRLRVSDLLFFDWRAATASELLYRYRYHHDRHLQALAHIYVHALIDICKNTDSDYPTATSPQREATQASDRSARLTSPPKHPSINHHRILSFFAPFLRYRYFCTY